MNELLLNLYIGYGYPEGVGMPAGLKKTAELLSESIIQGKSDKVLEILHNSPLQLHRLKCCK